MSIKSFFSKKDKNKDEDVDTSEPRRKKKVKKKNEPKNVDTLEFPLKARVTSSLSDEDEEEGDAGACKGGHQEKIKFSGEMVKVCLATEDDDLERYTKKLLGDLSLLVVYVDESSLEKAYYENSEKDSIYVFDGYQGNLVIEEVPLEGITAGEMAESYFEGEAHTRIDESLDAIRTNYIKESHAQEIILGIVALLFLAGVYYLLTDDSSVVRKSQAPRPATVKLSNTEVFFIKRGLTNQLIEGVIEDTKEFKEKKTLSGVKRIIAYNMNSSTAIRASEPITVDDQYWQWGQGVTRRGGLRYIFNKTEQQVYPGVGFIFSSDGIYTKSTQRSLTLDENFLDQNYMAHSDVLLTEECVVKALRLSSGEIVPKMRDDNKIEVNFKKVTPIVMIEDFLPLVQKCPVLIDRITMSSAGEFSFGASLYRLKSDSVIEKERSENEK